MRLLAALLLLAASAPALADNCIWPEGQERAPLNEVCPQLLEAINQLDLATSLRPFSADLPVTPEQLAAFEALVADYRELNPDLAVVDHSALRELIDNHSEITPLRVLSAREKILKWLRERLARSTEGELPAWLSQVKVPTWVSVWALNICAIVILLMAGFVLWREVRASGWLGARRVRQPGVARVTPSPLVALKPDELGGYAAAELNHRVGRELMQRFGLGDDRALTSPERARLINAHAPAGLSFLDELAQAADAEEFGATHISGLALERFRQAAARTLK